MDEQFVVSVVLGINLVVKLNVVEVDEVTDCAVNSDIAVIDIVLIFEVGCLGAVGDDVSRDYLAKSLGKSYEPLLAFTFAHGIIIFPVNICAVQVVVKHELT